ncbi:hypothetical protein HPO96_33470 [Kribbella sandramycini]|uniref:Putative membrane protein YecN with MAPEG domain n=1 Tax=Kribbella sandramycini TaxID=60450 RepID=A0A7Y4P4G1_9ACTN|nr:putative membrane protein YecN with MAPEG domain [Kribbella sandramycini]NOL45169.1 hypothetical protein [Kribbella sandramycini]
MTGLLLSVHVLGAILAVGPVAVAASMFPAAARADDAATTLRVLHRITRVYATIAIFVPVFGIATGAKLGVLGDTWLIVSMILTTAAAVVLIALVIPGQRALLAGGNKSAARRLGMQTGIFNLLWAVVVVLMIYRPDSTTGAGL